MKIATIIYQFFFHKLLIQINWNFRQNCLLKICWTLKMYRLEFIFAIVLSIFSAVASVFMIFYSAFYQYIVDSTRLCHIIQFEIFIIPQVAIKIQVLPSPKSETADGLHWDVIFIWIIINLIESSTFTSIPQVDTQSLYYTDQSETNPTLLRYDYRENRFYSARIKNRTFTSFIIPIKCKKNKFAVGIGRSIEIIQWDGYSAEAEVIRTVINVEPSDFYKFNVFDDAKADPCGRFFGGTLRGTARCDNDPKVANASLYSYTKKQGLIQWRSDVYISNGLTWNKKKKKFYYNDSCKLNIKEYDWDPKTGAICKLICFLIFKIRGNF